MSDMAMLLIFGLGVIVWFLWHIADHLKAIRASLADIARATGEYGDLSTIASRVDKTNKLLERAMRKKWGDAIDLPRY